MRRIVVTGMGAVSPLAAGVEATWSRLLSGQSGIRRLADEIVGDLGVKIGGSVPDRQDDPVAGFDPDSAVSPKDQRKMDRFILLGLAAAEEAIAQSGWRPATLQEQQRTATVVASGVGGLLAITNAVRTVDQRGAGRLSPFTVPSFLVNLAAGHISIRYGFKGPIGAPATACAAGVQAIGDGARLIRAGEADVVVCGGAEASINSVGMGGFAAARSLATSFNEMPARASRPFDAAREGFVIGEGAGIVVIESLDHALARGATPLAELVGYGTTSDAYHITSGPEDGDGARRAIEIAIDQAGVRPSDIKHLNAHATSTLVGDRGEIEAIKAVFGLERSIAVSATKSATGHLLGAAGGLEAIFTLLALRDQIAPPTLNLEQPDPAADGIDFVAGVARPMAMDYALSNAFGFGGVNASVLFRRWSEDGLLS